MLKRFCLFIAALWAMLCLLAFVVGEPGLGVVGLFCLLVPFGIYWVVRGARA